MHADRPVAFRRRTRTLALAALLAAAMPAFSADSKAARYYEDALSRYEKRDLPGAIIQLKNALQIDANMLAVQVLLGKALLGNGEVLAAEIALQEALRLGVNRAEIVLPLAQAYLAMGRHRLVLDQPVFALAGLPRDVQVQLMLQRASAASDLGDPRLALQTLGDAAAMAPQDADVPLAEIPIRIRTRQFREAEAALAKAAALAPQAAEVHYQRGALAHVQGNMTAALAAYDQTLQIDPKHGEARIARAGIYLDLQRGADAKRDLDELQKLLPREPRAAYLRAQLAQRDGQADAALAALKQVTDLLDPVPLDALRYRAQLLLLNGLAHFELKEREKAKGYLEALLNVQPETPASKLLAQIYLESGGADRAAPILEAYLKTQPGDGQAVTLLASSYMALGRNARAVSLMQESLRIRDRPEHRAVLGLGLLSSGRAADGQAELEAAWRKDPTQIQAGVALASLYIRNGKPAEAVGVAESLVKRAPRHAGFQDLLGMALASAGKLAPAKAAFERASALDPDWAAPQLHLARVEAAQKQFDAADARLATLLKKDEKNVDVLVELAGLAAQRGRADDQLRWLMKALDHAGRNELRPGLALVDLHLLRGRTPEALEVARDLNLKAGESLPAAMALARAQLASGDAAAARGVLSNAGRIVGYDVTGNLEIATLQLTAGHLEGAAYSLEKARSSEPGNLPALAMAVDLDLRRGNFAQAEQIARQITQQHPRRAIGYTLLGDTARARGQGGAAIDGYRRAHQAEPSSDTVLRLFRQLWAQEGAKPASRLADDWLRQRPQDLSVRRALADGYAAGGMYPEARATYESLLKQVPGDTAALNNLANVLLSLKDPGAVAMAEQAVSKAPGDAHALDTLGWALFQFGGASQRDRALQLLRDARLREPAQADIRYHLAMVLAAAGRSGEARDEAAAALKAGLAGDARAQAERLVQGGR
ncbi:XrtA/PEP-CTERM system TPR-repeat protein PrsT [Pseudorhodoferax sp.]|uniref:XrtA/PEP-CTERM system TPR-repeat protein PrsT n=1 Tax=Pseudorhodoferax sp. TaxID=1993553 RepID=UPI002DD62A93|nr:XrtA/PEP-CTERM system TPR-repeat protein PrsT [Pseudorhodoferax sp.]